MNCTVGSDTKLPVQVGEQDHKEVGQLDVGGKGRGWSTRPDEGQSRLQIERAGEGEPFLAVRPAGDNGDRSQLRRPLEEVGGSPLEDA